MKDTEFEIIGESFEIAGDFLLKSPRFYLRFFWNCLGGRSQTAYRILCRDEAGNFLWDSGRVESGWRKENGRTAFEVTIPANCTAEIRLPAGRVEHVAAGTYRW